MKKTDFTSKEEIIGRAFAEAFRAIADLDYRDYVSFIDSLSEEDVNDGAVKEALDAGYKECADAVKSYRSYLFNKAEDCAIQYVKKLREDKKGRLET